MAVGNGGGVCRAGPTPELFGTTVAAGALAGSTTTVGNGGGATVGVSAHRGGAAGGKLGTSVPDRGASAPSGDDACSAGALTGRTGSVDLVSSSAAEPAAR